MILLSDYINILKKTHNVQTEEDLHEVILNSLPLLYPGIQNMITRASRYYGSELTRNVEDDNIKALFDVLGVQPTGNTIDLILGKKKIGIRGQLFDQEEVRNEQVGGGFGAGIGRFLRANWLRIFLGALFTGLMIYIGNLNMLWMIMIAFLFKL